MAAPAMKPLGVHHVSLNVEDVEEAVRFYTEVLGLRARSDRPDLGVPGAWLDAGAQQLHLLQGAAPSTRGPHFALQVEDLDRVVAELRRRGVAVSDPVPIGTSRQAFVDDPSGNAVELHEVGAAAP